MSVIQVTRTGEGPEVLLVHGGASAATTWAGLEALAARWTLAMVHRRGFSPSPPPPGGRQDFDVDAADIAGLLDQPVHLVAHSYGGLGAAIAATRRPSQVRSLTLIEPPFYLTRDDPEAARLERLGDTVLEHGLETEPRALREFLRLAGAPVSDDDDAPLLANVVSGVRRAHGARRPGEAHPRFDVLRDSGVPSLVATGGHQDFMERMGDALATALGAKRVVAPGAGHFVAASPGFAERLEEFLLAL